MSWEELLSIREEAKELARSEREQPPTACPNDGEPLTTDRRGNLRCKFDGWTWDGLNK